MAKDTAESKLLKLIEETDAKDKSAGGSSVGAGASAASTAVAAPDATKLFNSVSSVGVGAISLPPFLQKIISIIIPGSQRTKGFGLHTANQLLLVLVLIVSVLFVLDFSRGMKESQVQVAFDVKQAPLDPADEVLPSVMDVVDYVTAVSQRNIFRPFEKKAEEAHVAAPAENQKIKDKVTNLKLVGISWLNTPETATAMIEDKSTSVTHFVKTGEDLQGIKVDVIYADRVEVSFQGEKMTINL